MNKIGTLDIIKAYLGTKELSVNNAYIGEIPLIKGSGPTPVPIPNDEIWYTTTDGLIAVLFNQPVTFVSNTYKNGKGIIKFSEDITSIQNYEFYECNNLQTIILPDFITSIGLLAFRNCDNLISIKLPNNLITIDNYAFNNCKNLLSIILPNTVENIGNTAFIGCNSLPVVNDIRYADTYLVTAIDKTLQTYNIKIGTKWIGSFAFQDCYNLSSIAIPNSVTNIGSAAFYGCTGLTSMNYTGTMAQWNVITKGNNWHTNVPATVVHCSDGDIAI